MALSPFSLGFWGKTLLKEKRHFFYLFGSLKFTQKIIHYPIKLCGGPICPVRGIWIEIVNVDHTPWFNERRGTKISVHPVALV